MHKKTTPLAQRGFTLMELMVVVVIIGVLSAVAVPSILRFINSSKESEGAHNLAAIYRGAAQYYGQEHTSNTTGIVFPSQFPSTGLTGNAPSWMPTPLPCKEIVGSPKYSRNSQRWHSSGPWVDLKFSIATSHYFRYGFSNNDQTSSAAAFDAIARADLNCNDKLSTFTLKGSVNTGTGEVQRSGVIVEDEGE